MAELAWYYITNDTANEVCCFTLEKKYKTKTKFCNLPVEDFEEIEKTHPPSEFDFFAPLYASKMNKTREEIYHKIKQKGYSLINYISSKAYVWNASLGDNCFIFEGVNIQPFCKIGNNNIIWSFSHIGHHSTVGDNNFISGNVVVAGHNKIENNCFLGTNCSTKDNVHISDRTFVGQDASVIRDLEPNNGVWAGVPAKRIKESNEINL